MLLWFGVDLSFQFIKKENVMKRNSVIEKAKKQSEERIKNIGKERLSKQQKMSRAWGIVFEKDTR